MVLFGNAGGSFFPGYRAFSKGIIGALAAITGVVPFSLADWLTAALIVFAFGALIWCVVKKRPVVKWLANTCAVLAAFVLFLVGCWGLNHYAPPLSDELGLEVGEYSADDLEEATAYYWSQAARLARDVPRGSDMALTRQDFHDLASVAGASYAGLSGTWDVFAGSTAPVKPLLLAGEPLLYSGHTGIFWPFTGEANVPLNTAIAEMPFTQCHEAAHRLGIASEQEANFAAFLACTEGDASRDARFAYAGYYNAFCYCLGALADNYPSRVEPLVSKTIGDKPDSNDPKSYGARLVLYDRALTQQHYASYDGPVEEVGTAVNDAYLKTFDEESGIKSYGEVVDYLIAWHLGQAK